MCVLGLGFRLISTGDQFRTLELSSPVVEETAQGNDGQGKEETEWIFSGSSSS
jgi:hypothetical protein